MECTRRKTGPFCWSCYEGLKGRRGCKNHLAPGGLTPRRMGVWQMAMKKPEVAVGSTSLNPRTEGTEWVTLWPSLWEFLTESTWDDGSKRQLPTLLFFFEEGIWKSCLSDKAMGRTGWCSGVSPEALLTSLDAQIRDDRVEWRKAKPLAGGRR